MSSVKILVIGHPSQEKQLAVARINAKAEVVSIIEADHAYRTCPITPLPSFKVVCPEFEKLSILNPESSRSKKRKGKYTRLKPKKLK